MFSMAHYFNLREFLCTSFMNFRRPQKTLYEKKLFCPLKKCYAPRIEIMSMRQIFHLKERERDYS